MARIALPLALLLIAGAAQAGGGVHGLWIGEGGASNPPTTGSAADYAESAAIQTATQKQETPKKEQPKQERAPAQTPALTPGVETAFREEGVPATGPQAETQAPSAVTPATQAQIARLPAPAAARNGGFVQRDPAAQRYYEGPSRERLSDAVAQPRGAKSSRSYKLWDSVGQPIEMNAAQIAKTPGVDDADAAARSEYERRILGRNAAPAAGSPAPSDSSMLASASAPALAKPAVNEVFVSVDVTGAPEQLKDAVAGLGSAAGFRLDPRFPPQASDFTPASGPGAAARAATSLRGWMPADRVNAAVGAPGVLRVQVDHAGPRADGPGAATTTLLVGLRIPAQASAGETFQREIADLASTARFKWTRTVGFQAIPDSKDVALVVVGEVPVTRIPKLLENPGVLKVAPAPLEPSAPEPAPRAPSRPEEFFRFARQRAPLLIALTLLLMLPSVGGGLLKLGQAFVPYDR